MREIIEFPGLWGLKIPVSREAFRIFGLPIFWYGIIIAFAFLLAVLLAIRQSSKYGIDPDNFIDLVLFLTPASIIGARLYYVAFTWEDFQGNFLDIINTRKGGLAIYGGIIAGLITAFIFARVKQINVLELFDFAIPYLPMAQAIGRWGNFINQEAYGINTNMPWGMTSDGIKNELAMNAQKLAEMGIFVDPSKPVHPTFLYESIWDLGVFLILIWHRKRKKVRGEVFFLYMILYGIGRAWIEGLRTDSLMMGNRRISQVLSIVFAITFVVVFIIRRRKAALASQNETVELGSSDYGEILKEFKKEDHSLDEIEEFIDEEKDDKEETNEVETNEEDINEEDIDEEDIDEEDIDEEDINEEGTNEEGTNEEENSEDENIDN